MGCVPTSETSKCLNMSTALPLRNRIWMFTVLTGPPIGWFAGLSYPKKKVKIALRTALGTALRTVLRTVLGRMKTFQM